MLNEYRQLLERIASGDVKALGILYIPYAGRVPDFAYSMLQNQPGAEDETHDLSLKI